MPTQLFECIFLALLTAVMIVLLFKFKFKYNFSLYTIAYGVWRFGIEFARDDHRGSFLGAITPSQFWSIIMVIVGIGFIFLQKYFLVRFFKHPEEQPPVRKPKRRKAVAAGVEETSIASEIAAPADYAQPEESAAPETSAEIAEAERLADTLTLDEAVGASEDDKSEDDKKEE